MCIKSLKFCTYLNYYFSFACKNKPFITDKLFCIENIKHKEITMWTTPSAVEMRYGFEVTAYIMTR